MKRQSPKSRRGTSRTLPLLVLAGALVLSIPAGCNALRFWRRLPVIATNPRFMPIEARQTALRNSLQNAPREVREAFAFQIASRAITGELTGAVEPERLPGAVNDAVRGASSSQLGRVQQAAARMLALERAGEPVERWWPAVRVFLEGLERAEFSHYEAALMERWASAYESLGAGAGTARELALAAVGSPHGPFLESFVERVRRLIDEREHAGDFAAAATLRTLRGRLLKQWTLDPGPPGVRLLAAELLAQMLEQDSSASAEQHAIASDLRAWVEAYRAAVADRPSAVLSPTRRPALAPAEHERLMLRTALTTWTAAALLIAAAVATLLSLIWIGGGGNAISARRLTLGAILATIVIVGGGGVWIWMRPESIRADFRADFSALRYWWLHPFVSAAVTLAMLVVPAAFRGGSTAGKQAGIARFAAGAAGTWLLLALSLWGAAVAGEFARRDYERAARVAYENPVAAMVGPEAQARLESLREWTP